MDTIQFNTYQPCKIHCTTSVKFIRHYVYMHPGDQIT